MCQALSLSRADYYRWRAGVDEVDPGPDMELRDQIQRIALEMPAYGYRRITYELRRRGIVANHKRVLRLMREDNLLCLRKKGFVRTTDSGHGLEVYPNLVPELVVNGLNQLWVADITYIRLQREFIYLAVILDAFSRRCIGWALSRTLEAELALAALRMALERRTVQLGLVHHSDRGVQYASEAYTNLLKDHEIRISMGRRGNPYDNAQAESFIKTLKYEEVYLFEYEDMAEARARLDHFLEEVYNERRLHSALGYVPPAEFEQQLVQRAPA
jgi:transposase InsO family protein